MSWRIGWLIDIGPRDIPVARAVGAELAAEYGVVTRLLPEAPTWAAGRSSYWEQKQLPLDAVVVGVHSPGRTDHLLGWKMTRGAKIIVLHSEQLIGRGLETDKLGAGRNRAFNDDVDAHIVWGPYFARDLCARAEVDPERIFIAGSPRVRARQGLREGGRKRFSFLFVSNFPLAGMSDGELEAARRRYGVRTDLVARRAMLRHSRQAFVSAANRVAQARPFESICVRLHPGESADAYSGLRDAENVELDVGDRPIEELLDDASAVVTYTSTVLFEAHLCGHNVVPVNFGLGPWGLDEPFLRGIGPLSPDEFVARAIGGDRFDDLETGIDETVEDLFSPSAGDGVRRTAASIAFSMKADAGSTVLAQRLRLGAFELGHRCKDALGGLATRLASFGLDSGIARRVKAAERAYESGPNRASGTIAPDPRLSVGGGSARPVRKKTDAGWLVSSDS